MTKPDAKDIYMKGYAAFDKGDYQEAIDLATKCIEVSPPDSYRHIGALGLRCWAANYSGDDETVEKDARALLSKESKIDEEWFNGLALFNLGLLRRRAGEWNEAMILFARASKEYAAYKLDDKAPIGWVLVNEFFIAVTHWCASGKTDLLDRLTIRLSEQSETDEEIQHLQNAVALYRRLAKGEDVTEEASGAAAEGVSRAFLSAILLGKQM